MFKRSQQATSSRKAEVDELVVSLIGGVSPGRGVASTHDSPGPSIPSTPLAQSTSLPGSSSLSLSGRISRQSDAGSDRVSVGTGIPGIFPNDRRETQVERYVV